jgi:hypothetical protein
MREIRIKLDLLQKKTKHETKRVNERGRFGDNHHPVHRGQHARWRFAEPSFDFHQTESTGSDRREGCVMAQCGNNDVRIAGRFENRLSGLGYDLTVVNP